MSKLLKARVSSKADEVASLEKDWLAGAGVDGVQSFRDPLISARSDFGSDLELGPMDHKVSTQRLRINNRV